MNKMTLGLLGLVAAALLIPSPATAIVGTNTHPYDNLAHGTPIGTNYAGFAYDSGSLVFCVPFYNYIYYPPSPQSPGCAAANVGTGTVQVTATDPGHWFTRVSGWCMTVSNLGINPNGVVVDVTDILGGVTRGNCKSNAFAGANFQVSSALPANSVKIHDTANYWGFDHLVFSSLI